MRDKFNKEIDYKSEKKLLFLVLFSGLFFLFFPLLEKLKELQLKNNGEILIKVTSQELGGFNPSEIIVNAKETLKLVFWSMDTTHSFNLPQIGIDLVLPAGEKLRQTIVTDFTETALDYTYMVNQRNFTFQENPLNLMLKNPLTLDFKCNRYCSHMHWSMRGRIIIFPPKNKLTSVKPQTR